MSYYSNLTVLSKLRHKDSQLILQFDSILQYNLLQHALAPLKTASSNLKHSKKDYHMHYFKTLLFCTVEILYLQYLSVFWG